MNDEGFRSLEGKSKHQLWLELCDLVTKHPHEVKVRGRAGGRWQGRQAGRGGGQAGKQRQQRQQQQRQRQV